jgi:hypothetical protein
MLLLLGTLGLIALPLVTAISIGQERRGNPLGLPDIRPTAIE